MPLLKYIVFIFFLGSHFACAEEGAKPLPKFEKLLPSELFFNKSPLPVGNTYGFATNKNLKELRKIILKALGEGWKLEIAPPEVVEKMNTDSKIQMEEVGRLIHEDYRNYTIGVTLTSIPSTAKEKFKGYSKILSIVTVDIEIAKKLKTKKAEQDGAEQPATAPQSKSQGNKNSKQESKVRSQ